MRYFLLTIAVQATVLLLYGQPDYFRTHLKDGPYPVGFKTILTYDLSRPAIAEQPKAERKGRFMQVNVWYPADKKLAETMNFGQYVRLLAFQTGKNDSDPAGFSEKQFFFNTSELKADTGILRKYFTALVKSKTKAFKNAGVASGSFPLVVFPDYANNQSILCEYLASHGYIVLSAPLKGTYTAVFDYSVAGLETGIADLQFALSVVRKEFPVKQSFTIMGLGIAATVALGLQMRNPDVAGIISLEGGITTGYEFTLIRQSPYFNNQRIDKPMLVIHAPHPDVKLELTDAYKYADRWLVSCPQTSEFYFLNYGVWESTITGILGRPPGDTKASFEAAADYVLRFLHAVDRKEPFAPAETDRSIATATYRQSVPLPPSIPELIKMADQDDIALVEKLYTARKQKDPEPIPFLSFFRVAEHLIADRKFSKAVAWTALFADAFPLSAVPWFLSGRCQLELNNKLIARNYYEKARMLLQDDRMLSDAEKDYYRPAIEKRIRELNG